MKAKCIYVIENPELNIVKIGQTIDINNRLNQLICASGCKLKLIGFSVGIQNADEIESIMHNYFKDFRRIGEWFKISPQDALSKLRELEKTHCRIDEVFKMYSDGVSITAIANYKNCSRQNIIYQLKRLGIHEKGKTVKQSIFEIEKGKIDITLEDNKSLIKGVFKPIEKNISTNGICYELKKWSKGSFHCTYYYTIEDAKYYRDKNY